MVAVTISFDDARPSQLSEVEILDRYGVEATFYVLPGAVEAHAAEWTAVAAQGHELGNHTRTHPCSGNFPFSRSNALERYNLERIAADIDAASASIEELTGVTCRTFAYPCGQSFVGRGSERRSYAPLVGERFVAGRGFNSESANDPDHCDLSHVEAMPIDGLEGSALNRLIDQVLAEDDGRGRWLVVAGHDIGTDGPQSVANESLEALCERVTRDDRLWPAPLAEVADHLIAGGAVMG